MKRYRLIIFISCFYLTNSITFAQPYFKRNDSIEVTINGNYIANAWAGGLNFIQPSTIDLNLDGIKDLFVFDRTGNKIRTFINNRNPNVVDYKYNPIFETKFPILQDWAILRDYNGDGKEDIFTYSSIGGGFDVYKNTSSIANGLQFQKVVTQQKSMYNPPNGSLINLYISSVDIPSIEDVDNDGDLDVITFAITGNYLEYHINKSIEIFGNADSLVFEMKNRCWGYATESALNNIFTLHDTCFGNVINPGIIGNQNPIRGAERHSGNCELCLDLDGDADKDLLVGGVSYTNLTALTNGGSLSSANMISVDTQFPSNNASTTPVNLTLFPCAYYLDINNDNVKDLIVSPNAPNASENFNSVIYYNNTGTTNFPVFQFQQSNLLQDNMIDVGEGAYPVFFDYDNDGLKDLFIGNYGYFGATNFVHKIAQFKNTGTVTQPKFDLITRDYNNLSLLGIVNMVPSFGDMDADGDADMMIGGDNGKLFYFENTSAAGIAANFVLSQANFKNSNNRVIDVGDFACPQIIDVDGDGKNDLIIGGRNGKIAYYHHTGSATATIPIIDSISHFWGNIKVNQFGYPTGYSYPFLFKQNGSTNLLVGTQEGYLRMYNQIDGNLNGSFTLVDSMYQNIYEGSRTALAGADINNDGFMDLIVGNYSGGVDFYNGVSSINSINDIENFIDWNFNLYPNPAKNSITIKIENKFKNNYIVEIYNLVGQLILSKRITTNNLTINTEELAEGIYVCKVSEINSDETKKTGALVKKIILKH
jgi:hypothetical protein